MPLAWASAQLDIRRQRCVQRRFRIVSHAYPQRPAKASAPRRLQGCSMPTPLHHARNFATPHASEFVVAHRDDSSVVEIVSDAGCPQARLRCSPHADATREDVAAATCPQANRYDARASESFIAGAIAEPNARAARVVCPQITPYTRTASKRLMRAGWRIRRRYLSTRHSYVRHRAVCEFACKAVVHKPHRGTCLSTALAVRVGGALRHLRSAGGEQSFIHSTSAMHAVACVAMRASSVAEIAPKRVLPNACDWLIHTSGIESPADGADTREAAQSKTRLSTGAPSRIRRRMRFLAAARNRAHELSTSARGHRGISPDRRNSSAHATTDTAAVDNSASIAPPTRGLPASNAVAVSQRLAAITAR